MKRSEIRELFVQAKDAYNSILGTDFNDKNLLLEFCTTKSAIKVFEKLCTAHFPHYLYSNPYTAEWFFENTKGMAFVENNMNAVLYITDAYVPKKDREWQGDILSVLLHEIGHIVCMRAETSETKIISSMGAEYMPVKPWSESGKYGYFVWRELITDMVGNHIRTKMTGLYREHLNRERLWELSYEAKQPGLPSSAPLTCMLSELLTVKEVVNSNSWDEAHTALKWHTSGGGYLDRIFPSCQIAYEQMKENGIFISKEFLCDFEQACLAYRR